MNSSDTASVAFAALGHHARLEVYRLLVRSGKEGMIIGDIARHTELPLSTLSHHLRTLVSAGLIVQEKCGREVMNRVDYDAINAVLMFLTEECCLGLAKSATDVA